MCRLFFCLFLCFVEISVVGQPKIIINPNSLQTGRLSLNDMVESIEYLPLETKVECLLAPVRLFIFSENYMLLNQREGFFLFSRSGRFVAKIGNQGGGPGEYYRGSMFHIDEKNKQVILYESYRKQLLYYNLQGRFIKSISYERESLSSFANYFINNHLVIKSLNTGHTPYTYTVLDKDYNIIKQQVRPVQYTMRSGSYSGKGGWPFCQYVYNNLMHVRENTLNDTLYMINNDFSFVPKFIINSGRHEVTVAMRIDGDLFMRELSNLLVLTNLFETKDYLFISYAFQVESFGYYNKSDSRFSHFSSSSGIPNDYDGGLDFWPMYQHNNQLIGFVDAYKIKEHKDKSNKLTPKGSAEAINRFEQMSRKLDAEDNPVMVIVNLK